MKQQLNLKEIVESVFRLIPELVAYHKRDHELYQTLNRIVRAYFSDHDKEILDVEPFQGMIWPHVSLGNLTSYDFFALDEIVLYIFYFINRNRYKTAFDIGANIGIDSIILSRFGYEVYSYEPDPGLCDILRKNMSLNSCNGLHVCQKGISDKPGVVDFVRVKGNTTASHILGARDFYGEVEYVKVETMTFQEIGLLPDLMKINVEGHEKTVVSSIDYHDWEKIDTFIEIHDEDNGEAIYNYFLGTDLNIFSQKLGWQKAECLEDMPANNKEGYIFISKKEQMPW